MLQYWRNPIPQPSSKTPNSFSCIISNSYRFCREHITVIEYSGYGVMYLKKLVLSFRSIVFLLPAGYLLSYNYNMNNSWVLRTFKHVTLPSEINFGAILINMWCEYENLFLRPFWSKGWQIRLLCLRSSYKNIRHSLNLWTRRNLIFTSFVFKTIVIAKFQ